MAIAVVSAVWFADGGRPAMLLGAALLYVAFVLDCVDGQLARYTRQFSTLGAWLDATFDRAKEYVAYAGLAAGAVASGAGEVWGLAIAALGLQTVRHMIDFSFGAARRRRCVAAAAGDLSGLMAFGLESARTLGSLRYGRRAEAEADREGMRLLIASGLNPAGMIAFFEALARRENGPSRVGWARYLSSHPATEARLAELRALAATATQPPRKLLPDYDWSDIPHICG